MVADYREMASRAIKNSEAVMRYLCTCWVSLFSDGERGENPRRALQGNRVLGAGGQVVLTRIDLGEGDGKDEQR